MALKIIWPCFYRGGLRLILQSTLRYPCHFNVFMSMFIILNPVVCGDNHKESWKWLQCVDTWSRATANWEARWLKEEGTTTQMRVDGDGQGEASGWNVACSLTRVLATSLISFVSPSPVRGPLTSLLILTSDPWHSEALLSSRLPLPCYYCLFCGPFSVHSQNGCVSVKIPANPCRHRPAACLAPTAMFKVTAAPLSFLLSCLF